MKKILNVSLAIMALLLVLGTLQNAFAKPSMGELAAMSPPEAFQAAKAAGVPVFLEFYADWCGPCKTMKPTLEKLQQTYKDKILFVRANVDDAPNKALARQFGVRAIPCGFIFNVKGAQVEQFVGLTQEADLDAKLRKALK